LKKSLLFLHAPPASISRAEGVLQDGLVVVGIAVLLPPSDDVPALGGGDDDAVVLGEGGVWALWDDADGGGVLELLLC